MPVLPRKKRKEPVSKRLKTPTSYLSIALSDYEAYLLAFIMKASGAPIGATEILSIGCMKALAIGVGDACQVARGGLVRYGLKDTYIRSKQELEEVMTKETVRSLSDIGIVALSREVKKREVVNHEK